MDENLSEFIEKYNHLKIDEYLDKASKIDDIHDRLNYWVDLLSEYKNDLNRILYINKLYSINLLGNHDLRYKKGGFLSDNLETICEKQIDDLKFIIEKQDIKPDLETDNKPPYDYYTILEMLATNEIEIFDKDIFKYKGKKYQNASELNRLVNSDKGLNPNVNFEIYLNHFRNKAGDKYILKTNDIDGKPDHKLIKRLRKFKEYAESKLIKIVNQDFKDAFRNI